MAYPNTIAAIIAAAYGVPRIDVLELLSEGAAGTGAYVGYTLAHVEKFDGALSSELIRPGNPFGKWSPAFSQRDRRHTALTSVSYTGDPYSTGHADANDGVPIPSLGDIITMSGGVMRLKGRTATASERPLLGVRSNASGPSFTYRPVVQGHVHGLAHSAATGARIVEWRWRMNMPAALDISVPGVNAGVSYWALLARGGAEAVAGKEDDYFEYTNAASGLAAYETGGDWTPQTYASKTDGAWQITRATFTATTIKLETYADDGVTLVGSTTDNYDSTRLNSLWYFMFGAIISGAARGYTYDESKWTSTSEFTTEISSYRVWIPSASVAVAAAGGNTTLEIDYGSVGSLVLPSQSSVWGAAVTNERIKFHHATDINGPGRVDEYTSPLDVADTYPVGTTYTSGTRTLAFSNTFSVQAGVVHGAVYPERSDIGFAKPLRFAVYVRPKLTIPALPAPTPGAAYSYTIPRGARNWDNGNCPHGSHSGLTLVSGPGWLSFDPVTRILSGACPGGFTSAALVFRCTNGAGIYTDGVYYLGAGVGANDTFFGQSGVLLTDHLSESAQTWQPFPPNPPALPTYLNGSGGVYNTDTVGGTYIYNYAPPSANYAVEADLVCLSEITDTPGVCARASASASPNDLYLFRYSRTAGGWQIFKTVGGTNTQIGATYAATFTVGQTKTLRFEVNGSTLTGKVDGVVAVTATDASITATGRAGLRTSGTPQTMTTGTHIKNFKVYPL
jgi:hypothetical protein